MNHQIVVQQRQQQLLIRSTELRYQLRGSLDSLHAPAAALDSVVAGASWLRQNPAWPLACIALMVVLKPRRAISWGSKLWWMWRGARQVQNWRTRLQKMVSR